MAKIWHKPLHKRKMWRRMSFRGKMSYYLKPFLIHVIDVWQQPLPFPTLFKFLYTFFIFILLLLPIIFPLMIIFSYYAAIQYLIERSTNELKAPAKQVEKLIKSKKINIFESLLSENTHISLNSLKHMFSKHFFSSLDIVYPKNLDIIRYLIALFNFETRNDIYGELLNLYAERWRFVITTTASCVDNMRLILVLVTI